MDIAINEWIYSYLTGEEEKVEIADIILTEMFGKCDRLVYVKGSPMNEKVNMLSKFNFPKQREIIKKYFRMVYPYNSEKVILLEKNELKDLPRELINSLPHKEKDKDIYLVQACLQTDNKIIVTVDNDLKKAIDGKYGIKVKLVDEFLQEIKNA